MAVFRAACGGRNPCVCVLHAVFWGIAYLGDQAARSPVLRERRQASPFRGGVAKIVRIMFSGESSMGPDGGLSTGRPGMARILGLRLVWRSRVLRPLCPAVPAAAIRKTQPDRGMGSEPHRAPGRAAADGKRLRLPLLQHPLAFPGKPRRDGDAATELRGASRRSALTSPRLWTPSRNLHSFGVASSRSPKRSRQILMLSLYHATASRSPRKLWTGRQTRSFLYALYGSPPRAPIERSRQSPRETEMNVRNAALTPI